MLPTLDHFSPKVSVPNRSGWAYTKDGKDSVKSGNWVLTREADLMEIVPADIQAANKTKERLWKLRLFLNIRLLQRLYCFCGKLYQML